MELVGPLLKGSGDLTHSHMVPIVGVEGNWVIFADDVNAFWATSGLWYRNVAEASLDLFEPVHLSASDLVIDLFPESGLADLFFIEDAAAGLDLLAESLRGSLSLRRSAMSGDRDAGSAIISPSDDGQRVVVSASSSLTGERRFVAIDSVEAELPDLAALVVVPAIGYGTTWLPVEDIDGLIQRLAPKRALLVADETVSGFFRSGVAFAHEQWEQQPDAVILGPALVNGGADVYAVATTLEVGRKIRESQNATADPEPEVMEMVAATVSRVKELRASGAATHGSELLGRGLQIMVDTGLVTDLDGRGLSYLVAATPEIRSVGGEGLLEALRQEDVWAAADREARLLLLPPANMSAADVARLLDGVHSAFVKIERSGQKGLPRNRP